VLAGLPLAAGVFGALNQKLRLEMKFPEGASVPPGATVALLHGRAGSILSGERTALNFLAHLSGIATLTRRFVEAIAGTRAQIRDTRKTTPLLRRLEKYAVRMGGGSNHRFGLFDAILIKENHIALAGGVRVALARARAQLASLESDAPEMTAYETFHPPIAHGKVSVQIEVRNEAELREALAAGADAVLLDNVSPAEAGRLVALVGQERPSCVVEVSGGVTLATVRPYAEAGVDFISVGALTHSAPAADLSLLVEPLEHE
jgi:nicotinate-nucleotide pyrophosphorylase (carboxylating)